MPRYRPHALRILFLLIVCCPGIGGQTPFERTGQVYLTVFGSSDMLEFGVDAGNVLKTGPLGAPPAGGMEAIGFRKTDNLLYGINPGNNHLFQIGRNGGLKDLGKIGLDDALFYVAGDVSPDGKSLVSIGSAFAGPDVHLAKTNLEGGNYTTQFVPLSGAGYMRDIAFDPYGSELYGYDGMNRRIIAIDPNTGATKPLATIGNINNIFGLYFDAFGDLYAYGSTQYGIVDALFRIDKTSGKETLLATGPAMGVTDAASCPFSVGFKNTIDPGTALPCSELTSTYTIANKSEQPLPGVSFEHRLPPGFHFAGTVQNPFGVPVDTLSVPGALSLKNFNLQPGIWQLSVKLRMGDIPKGLYKSQAVLRGLPVLHGKNRLSDNTATAGFADSSFTRVNRFDEDSLFYNWFICHGETMELDASAYGGNVRWDNGSTETVLIVSKGGIYVMEAGNTCESVVVRHDVTSASCPFTIAVAHLFAPDTIFPCSETIFRFIIRNDSGEPRYNISFADTLPAGFTFKKIAKNPFGGKLKTGLPPGIVNLEGLTLKVGKDTLDLLVEAGDLPPGNYLNRARIYDLPRVMGPMRWSDDPATLTADSTPIHILGTQADTLFFTDTICANTVITLDAGHLGKSFLWDDGSTEPTLQVQEEGVYHLTLFDGCFPSDVYWTVVAGALIDIAPVDPMLIHQGEQITLDPLILNAGDTLAYTWTDPPGQSLSCLDCPLPVAMPLQSAVYGLKVSNSICQDSAGIEVQVDQTRRIYAPNVFSPNNDGLHDYFYLQSPDFGIIRSFRVFDRWGNVLYSSGSDVFNDLSGGWDGNSRGKPLPPGVYIWQAEVEFIDNTKKVLSGEVTVVR
ncbi:MAG: gliding motility-associated C-terminal domain-containing protein [Thermoanaerobaculia bacterium]|nr:gliding motility-associated C-terminal domain-containing protein [Thermoanaerobaculia bacterium]